MIQSALTAKKRELLMLWKQIEERKTDLLWRANLMTDSEVEAAYEELTDLIDRIEKIDDEITEGSELILAPDNFGEPE